MTVDQLVAAPYSHDDKWYRARVTELVPDDYDIEESQVTLYYLDYGDSDTLRKKEVCSLRADFLKLRYQAIECSIAKVKPMWVDIFLFPNFIGTISRLCIAVGWETSTDEIICEA